MGYADQQDYISYIHSTDSGIRLDTVSDDGQGNVTISLIAPEENSDIGVLLDQASDAIDALCFGRIRKVGFDNLTEFQREKVKKAVCYHAAFLHTYGDMLNSPLTSYGINGVSMSFAMDRLVTQGGVTTNQAVMQQLRQSGLATRLIP